MIGRPGFYALAASGVVCAGKCKIAAGSGSAVVKNPVLYYF
jgi:hypothetical protein